MKLYYASGACSMATHILLEWIGKPYELQKVGLHPKSPELVAANPFGAVPVLEDNGFTITQNNAILHYLTEKFPEAKLMGDGSLKVKAKINQYLGIINADLHPLFKPFFGSTAYLEDAAAIEKSKKNAATQVRTKLELIDRSMSGVYLAGVRSIVDPYFFVMLNWCNSMQIQFDDLKNVSMFFESMKKDPAVFKVLKDEGLI
ncbi:MAG TPA: glutathione S-transferase N-terminal domain-containing protein [Turneriella sp.]|nr:glutathione S-transferase N-terminal domain-containing protein [Turneriella sp.]